MLLAVILLASPAPLPDGCALETLQTGIVIKCADTMATANLGPDNVAPATYVESALAGIKARLGVAPVTSKLKLRLAGAELDVVQYSVGEANGWVSATPSARGVRVIGCMARRPIEGARTICLPLLERLSVAELAPLGSPKPSALPDVGGKRLTVPTGCTYDGASDIKCADGHLFWNPVSKVSLSAAIDVLANALSGSSDRDELSCVVGGKKSQCYALHKKDGRGQTTMHVLVGEWSSGDQKLHLFCAAPADPVSKMPIACGQVFTTP